MADLKRNEYKEVLMYIIRKVRIKSYEKGIYFKNGELKAILDPGVHWVGYWMGNGSIEIVSQRDPWLTHEKLDIIVKSGLLGDEALTIDLNDTQRALVWIDNRFSSVLSPGLYAIWRGAREVRVEIVEAKEALFRHDDLEVILKSGRIDAALNMLNVEPGNVAVYFQNGAFAEVLGPGQYAFWKNTGKVKIFPIDMRETVLDISGQDIMTSDKVTLRMNAVINYRVTDALKSVNSVDDSRQALYREAQLALRALVGAYALDDFLTEKNALAGELHEMVRKSVGKFGLEVLSVGIRDIILPGDMKKLLNKVTEAKKAAEANLISRREETAAMRSQVNTARLIESNPTLMRLRELEVLETVARTSKLNIVLGDKGLKDRLVNMI